MSRYESLLVGLAPSGTLYHDIKIQIVKKEIGVL